MMQPLAGREDGSRPDIGEQHFCMAMRRVISSKDGQRPLDLDSRSSERNQNHALLLMRGRIWVRLSHEDDDLASAVHRSCDPDLVATDYVLITHPLDQSCKQCYVIADSKTRRRRSRRRDAESGFS
jgi:hypothetical protein